jgi:hypothetical protein
MPKKRQNRLGGIGFGPAFAGPIDQGRQRDSLETPRLHSQIIFKSHSALEDKIM